MYLYCIGTVLYLFFLWLQPPRYFQLHDVPESEMHGTSRSTIKFSDTVTGRGRREEFKSSRPIRVIFIFSL